AQERAELQDIVDAYRARMKLEEELAGTREILELSDDEEMTALAQEDIARLEAEAQALDERLRLLLIPKDPRDEKNVIMEIRAGAGGDEAAIFAADLLRMYMRYAEAQRWRTEI